MITHDLRYGWRLMLRRPGFTAVAVLTLGLGIGANVTIYSWIEALLLRPFAGVAGQDRLMVLTGTTRTRGDLSWSWPNFVDLRGRRPDTVEDLIASRVVALNVRTTGDPERVWGQIVSGNFFDVARREADHRPRVSPRRGPHAERGAGRGPQLRLLAHTPERRSVDRRPNRDAERPRVHGRRRRAAVVPRQRRRPGLRRLGSDDDADGGDAGRSPRAARRRLAAGDGEAEAGRLARARTARLRRPRRAARGRLPGECRPRRAPLSPLAGAGHGERRDAARAVDPDGRRRRRAADCVRERDEPAADARGRPPARNRRPPGARREPRPSRAAALHRDDAAGRGRRRGRRGDGVLDVGICCGSSFRRRRCRSPSTRRSARRCFSSRRSSRSRAPSPSDSCPRSRDRGRASCPLSRNRPARCRRARAACACARRSSSRRSRCRSCCSSRRACS